MRRYLYNGSLSTLPLRTCDVLIVGSGLAGLFTALNIDPALQVIIINKHGLAESNSMYAQGGIAAAVAPNDDPDLHYQDSMIAGAYLCEPAALRILVDEGPDCVRTLQAWGVPFDCAPDGSLAVGQEGAHSRKRIVHCHGDATGFYSTSRLAALLPNHPNIEVLNDQALVDLVTDDQDRAAGAVTLSTRAADTFSLILARQIILATGGIGQLYQHSTNALPATGDALAAAIRAGAAVRDLEFVQFHPTALPEPDEAGRCFLISEAVRGEGAILRNLKGEAFMAKVHPQAELAPRDVVSRAIFSQMLAADSYFVYLDITHHSREFLRRRFPMIFETCLQRGLDMAVQWLPVAPVQHYFMGGVHTDLQARTSMPNLLACGEVAHTGIYGANRLASNSLLECLVFGRRAALTVSTAERVPLATVAELDQAFSRQRNPARPASLIPPPAKDEIKGIRQQIRHLMTRYCGILRDQPGLDKAELGLAELLDRLETVTVENLAVLEACQMVVAAQAIVQAASHRKYSIGAHFRTDDPEAAARHDFQLPVE